jgi:hypothetical protein
MQCRECHRPYRAHGTGFRRRCEAYPNGAENEENQDD